MKLLEGKTLADALADAHDTDARLALLPSLLAVADALGYAHEHRRHPSRRQAAEHHARHARRDRAARLGRRARPGGEPARDPRRGSRPGADRHAGFDRAADGRGLARRNGALHVPRAGARRAAGARLRRLRPRDHDRDRARRARTVRRRFADSRSWRRCGRAAPRCRSCPTRSPPTSPRSSRRRPRRRASATRMRASSRTICASTSRASSSARGATRAASCSVAGSGATGSTSASPPRRSRSSPSWRSSP